MTMKYTYFTQEQEQWLRENYFSSQSYAVLTEQFNAAFGAVRSIAMIRDKCNKSLGLKGMPNPTTYGKKQREQ